jgi:predicted nucleotidyltransferase
VPYVDQVTAAFVMARNRLAQAAKESSATVVFGRLLSRSFEFAVQGVFMAWGYPVKVTKVQRYFDSVLAVHLEAPDADFIRAVWGTEGTQLPELDLGVAVAASTALIDRMEGLAGSTPSAAWSPPPVPPSIGWTALSRDDQRLLTRVHACVRALCPGARVVLFGSRASGTGNPDSDYDLLVILPDGTEQNVRSAIMGGLYDLAQQLGVEFDREYVSLSTWQDPGPADRDLVGQAKNFGIEIPDHEAGT